MFVTLDPPETDAVVMDPPAVAEDVGVVDDLFVDTLVPEVLVYNVKPCVQVPK